MDIREWPMGQIMQLPDHCFGRRFIISCNFHQAIQGAIFDISEIAFPELCVIWELLVVPTGGYDIGDSYRLALGDQLPPSTVEFNALEPLIHGLGATGAEPRTIQIPGNTIVHLVGLKIPVNTMGRRLVVAFSNTAAVDIGILVALTVSAIPTEVPDCLLSV